MKIKITFALAASGRSYFEKFLRGLSTQDRAVVLAVFQEVTIYGLSAKGCEFRQVEGKLWELKIRAANSGYRFFYVLLAVDHMHVLHSYKKQSQKAPMRELEVARKRVKGVFDEN